MTAQRMTTTRDRIEQRLAHGDLPEEIATRLGAPLGEVLRIGEQMDAAARHVDDPRNDPPPPPTCSQGHHLTPDNLAPRGDTRRECRACKQKRDRARAKKVARGCAMNAERCDALTSEKSETIGQPGEISPRPAVTPPQRFSGPEGGA